MPQRAAVPLGEQQRFQRITLKSNIKEQHQRATSKNNIKEQQHFQLSATPSKRSNAIKEQRFERGATF
jgi:hypothetical protein